MPADVTVLDIVDAGLDFAANYGNTILRHRMFVPLLTMVDGRVAYRQIFF